MICDENYGMLWFDILMIKTIWIVILLALVSGVEISEQTVTLEWSLLSAQLDKTVQLKLVESSLTEESFIKVLSHPMPQLKRLAFSQILHQEFYPEPRPTILNPTILKVILNSEYFPRLVELDLSNTNLDEEAFSFLENSTVAINSSLQVLRIKNLLIGKRGFQRLSKIDFGGKLKELDVTNTLLIQEQTVKALLKIICKFQNQRCQSELQKLNLEQTELTPEGFITIIKTINTISLQVMNLDLLFLHRKKTYQEGFNYTAFQILADTPFPNLLNVTFRDSGFNDQTAMILSRWKVPRLRVLTVSNNPLGDKGIKALITKKSKPDFENLSVFGTNITDATLSHIREQNFKMKSFNFGSTKITNKGFSQLQKMDLSNMVRLLLQNVYIEEDSLVELLESMDSSSLEFLYLKDLSNMKNLLNEISWKKLHRLRKLHISHMNLEDSFSDLFSKRQKLSTSLTQIQLESIQMSTLSYNVMAVLISIWFPNIQYVSLKEQNLMPIFLPVFKTESHFKEGTEFDFGYIRLKKRNNIFLILSLVEIEYLFAGLSELSEAKPGTILTVDDIIKVLITVVSFEELQDLILTDQTEMEIFKMILSIAHIRSFDYLRTLALSFELNSELFFTLFESISTPQLATLQLYMTIPGDQTIFFVTNTLTPFFTKFQNMQILNLGLNFLNEEEGSNYKADFFESLNYPFLVEFMSIEQELRAEDVSSFLAKHGDTLRVLMLDGNFLEQSFMDLLVDIGFKPLALSLSKIYLTVEEFQKLGRLDLSFLKILKIMQNDLTDQHFLGVVTNSSQTVYFPNIEEMYIEENDVGRAGLESWLSTGMPNLKFVDMQNNRNPAFLNLILKYPNKIASIMAQNVEIYSLDKDISPQSVYHVTELDLKTFSFNEEDFQVLGSLEFTSLQTSVLWMNNIYDCQSLKNLLKINRWTNAAAIIFRNDDLGLNSSCLKGPDLWKSRINILIVQDQYGTTYLPQFIQILANSQQSIKILSLSKTRLSPQSLSRILKNNFNGVKVIDLSYTYVNDEALVNLVNNDLDHLGSLDLSSTGITAKGVELLREKSLPSLMSLSLSGNSFEPEIISSIEFWSPNLAQLKMNNCNLDSSFLDPLLKVSWGNLNSLELNYNQFTEESVVNFLVSLERRRMPQISVIKMLGVFLSKENYDTVTRVLTTKGIENFVLERPYNIVQPNSAQY